MVSDPSQSQQKADHVLSEETATSPQLAQEVSKAVTPISESEASVALPVKEALKLSPKKPKKRKPKTLRDETAPRQPLTGKSKTLINIMCCCGSTSCIIRSGDSACNVLTTVFLCLGG